MEALQSDPLKILQAYSFIKSVNNSQYQSAHIGEFNRNGAHYWKLSLREWGGIGSADYELKFKLSDLEAWQVRKMVEKENLHWWADSLPKKPRVRVKAKMEALV